MTATRKRLRTQHRCSLPRAGRRSRSRPRWPTRRRARRRAPACARHRPTAPTAPATRIAWIVGNPDDRHVETHVLLRLRHLDDAHAGTGQVPGPADHFVGPFHRLDRDDGLVLHGDRLADVERGDRVGHPVAEREILRAPRSFGARRSARPRGRAAARGTPSSRCSSMPSSRITSATAEISASVLRALRRVSTDSSVRSGMMPEKILTCLTCPAITARDTPAAFQDLDALAELPERHPVEVRAGVARRRFEVRERLFLDRDDGDVVAQAAGARSTRNGNRPLPAMRPILAHGVDDEVYPIAVALAAGPACETGRRVGSNVSLSEVARERLGLPALFTYTIGNGTPAPYFGEKMRRSTVRSCPVPRC